MIVRSMPGFLRGLVATAAMLFVTGAGARDGIGFAIARALAEAGLTVNITGASERVHERVAELAGEGLSVSSSVFEYA